MEPTEPQVMGEPDENPTKLIFQVRHGETALNAKHLMRGWDDPDLNEAGRQDAQAVAKALKDIPLDAVFCSDLKRAVSTMQAIEKDNVGKPAVTVTPLLRTIDVGAWTGRPVESVEPHLAKLQKQWETDPSIHAPHGESWDEFQGRQLKAWAKILAARGKNILVVSHLRCSVWSAGYCLEDQIPLAGERLRLLGRLTQAPARITTFSYSKAEGMKLLGLNAQEPEGR